jgi:anti-sigma regulatory factor (Ser/Thr protein kinase)
MKLVESTDPRGSYEAQLAPELKSVVAARRLLGVATQAWHVEEGTAGDAALTMSELVTNSVLHARTPVGVAVRRLGTGVRIEVSDGNDHLPVLEAARPEDLLANRSMTGRGLALVAAMSDRWGADPTTEGKVTWAEVGTGQQLVSSVPPAVAPVPGRAKIRPGVPVSGVVSPSVVAGDGTQVHLIGVPVQLLIESTRQLSDLQREMQVMAMDQSAPSELDGGVEGISPFSWDLSLWAESDRELAEAAVARGDQRLDLDVTVPPDIVDRIDRIVLWLRRMASSLLRRHLLTLPASDEVNAYRYWIREEIVSQLGGRPPQPCPLEIPHIRM